MSCRNRGEGGGGVEYNSNFFNQIINYQNSKFVQSENQGNQNIITQDIKIFKWLVFHLKIILIP